MDRHGDFGVGKVHQPYNWSYADAAARTAATGFVAADVGKLARQLDDDSLWMLTDDSPETWVQIGGTGVSGTFTTEEGDTPVDAATATLDFDASDFNVSSSPAGEANISLNYGSGAGQPAEGNHGHTTTVGFSINLGDGVNVITSSEPPVYVRLPVAYTWTRWDIQADASGTIVVEVDRATDGSPDSFSSIAGTAKPMLSGPAQSASDSSLASWGDTSTDAGDRIRFTVSGTPSVVKRVAVHITATRAV
jgi:hypothetical protein